MSKITIITGSYPPEVCGVGDYTKQLVSVPEKIFDLYYRVNWRISSIIKHIKGINKLGNNTINLQYPTIGYGWSIVPHLLCIYYSLFTNKTFSVTIHEQSQLTLKSRIALYFMLLVANKIIFTNEYEFNYAVKRVPCIKRRSSIIKIFSNIASSADIKPICQRANDVVNFGLIRPNKGIETFLEQVASLTSKYKICIAGQVPNGCQDYYSIISEKAKKIGVKIILNLSNEEVSCLLNDTKIVYLPFPDGISEKRGSYFAAAINGAVVYTNYGDRTTEPLKIATINCIDFPVEYLLKDEKLLQNKQRQGLLFMQTEMPHSWNDVACAYGNFILNNKLIR